MKRAILFLVIFGFAYNASAQTISAGAEVLPSITIPEQAQFDSGQFAVGVSDGVVEFDMGKIISSSPGITLVSSGQGGVARLVGAGNSGLATVTVTITVTGTTLASGVETAVIVSHCRGPGSVLDVDKRNCPFSSEVVITDNVNISDNTPQYDLQAVGF